MFAPPPMPEPAAKSGWSPMPEDDRQRVIDAAKSVPGVLDAYHLVAPEAGDGLSIAFFEDEVGAVRAAIADKAAEIGWHDQRRPAPQSGTFYRVIRHG